MKYVSIENENKEIEAFVFTGKADFVNTPSWFYMSLLRDDFEIMHRDAPFISQLVSKVFGNFSGNETRVATKGDWICFDENRIIFFMEDEQFRNDYRPVDDATDTFSNLREANISRQAEWDTGTEPLSLSFKGNELAGETGELCNVLKKLERERLGIPGSRDTVEHAAEEMADVIICVDLIATHLGVDLWQAVANKFNATSEKNGMKTRLVIPNG